VSEWSSNRTVTGKKLLWLCFLRDRYDILYDHPVRPEVEGLASVVILTGEIEVLCPP
jgi:hypothetical protein